MLFRFNKECIYKRRNIFGGVLLFLMFSVYLFYNVLTFSSPLEDLPCNFSEMYDALPSVYSYDYSISSKSIFFHDTSCKGNLTSRQSCAIESAARAHPDFKINVLFCEPVPRLALEYINLKQLTELDNVRFARIHIGKYAKGTPVSSIVTSGDLERSLWRKEHTSDVLRFLSLYKWGGIYLDTDVVVAKRLDSLGKNWAARESDTDVATGALAFSMDEVGRRFAESTVREIQTNFRGDIWGHNGPGVITRVLKKTCSTNNVVLMNSATCKGFEVYGPELFYPISWQNGEEYFKQGELKNKDAYVYHVWNHLTKHLKVHKDSPYAELARRYCPLTYKLYGDQFGT